MKRVGENGLSLALSRWTAAEPRVVAAGNFATPSTLLQWVDKVLPQYRLFMLNAQPSLPDRPGVTYETPFIGPGMRGAHRLEYLPARLSLVPRLFATTRPPDVLLLHTSLPRDGKVSMGVEVNILPAAREAVRARGGLVIAQLNPQMPYTFGDAELDVDDVDLAVEVDEPLATPAFRPPDEVSLQIADRVVTHVPVGATLQLGIGAVPDAVLAAMRGRRNLRIWSEMFSDGVLRLERDGALDAAAPVVTSFVFGSPELFAWLDRNQRVHLLRTETTNDPSRIAAQRNMTSINSALQVDLFAQANASRIGDRMYSGFGGQTDFIVGALHSVGGTSLIALPSWHPRANVSTVVPVLQVPVTSFQHGFIVSENGAAAVWGYDQDEQAGHLISDVAHPSVRDELRTAGRALGLAV
jgi:acyl-CoA hydrolase